MAEYLFKLKFKQFLPVIKSLFLLFSIAIAWYLLKGTRLGTSLQDLEWVRLKITEAGYWGSYIFICLGTIIIAIGFPRLAFSAAAGFVFGFTEGAVLGQVATILGCILTFYYAKFLGREWVESRLSERVIKYETLISENSFSMTLIIRLFPIGNSFLTNLLAGISSVRALPFFFASFLGFIPQTLIFALMGSGIRKEPWLRSAISAILLGISLMILFIMIKRIKKKGN